MKLDNLSMPTQWKLDDGLELVRALQPLCRKYGYHLALGGGVLNKGFSDKDLDLYFLPMGGFKIPANPEGLVDWLGGMWGHGDQIGEGRYPDELPYIQRLTFEYGRQRIDVFVLGASSEERARKEFEAEDEAELVEAEAIRANGYPGEPVVFRNRGYVAGRVRVPAPAEPTNPDTIWYRSGDNEAAVTSAARIGMEREENVFWRSQQGAGAQNAERWEDAIARYRGLNANAVPTVQPRSIGHIGESVLYGGDSGQWISVGNTDSAATVTVSGTSAQPGSFVAASNPGGFGSYVRQLFDRPAQSVRLDGISLDNETAPSTDR